MAERGDARPTYIFVDQGLQAAAGRMHEFAALTMRGFTNLQLHVGKVNAVGRTIDPVGLPVFLSQDGHSGNWLPVRVHSADPIADLRFEMGSAVSMEYRFDCAQCGSRDHRDCQEKLGTYMPIRTPIEAPPPPPPPTPTGLLVVLPAPPRDLPPQLHERFRYRRLDALVARARIKHRDDGVPLAVREIDAAGGAYEYAIVDVRLPLGITLDGFETTLTYRHDLPRLSWPAIVTSNLMEA